MTESPQGFTRASATTSRTSTSSSATQNASPTTRSIHIYIVSHNYNSPGSAKVIRDEVIRE